LVNVLCEKRQVLCCAIYFSDILCGLLFCQVNLTSKSQMVHFNLPPVSGGMIYSGIVNGVQRYCSYGSFNVFYAGGYNKDPGLVPDGSTCGTNKVRQSVKLYAEKISVLVGP